MTWWMLVIWSRFLCLHGVQFSSVTQSCPNLCDPMDCSTPAFLVHHQLPDLTQTHVHRVSQWCHPTIWSSAIPFSSRLQSFPSIRVFSSELVLGIRWPKYWSFTSLSVLPMNTQDWSALGWTGWISLQSKGLSRVLSNTTSKTLILQCSAFFIFHFSHPYMTTGKDPDWRERLKAGGEGDGRGWDGWMASPTWWTWVWAGSGSWWWTT